ncbi:hypothetical protein ACO0K2_06770 [Undibacterium sp. MH2W]|uniref:hypothetical protein n=1 Tax=Undibacterium sp. MH2W TaxID=3413044 RepID=UPI003BF21695
MTKNEHSVEDLQSESWIIANEISDQRGFQIDFSNVEDEQLLMRSLFVKHVRRGDWRLRRAVRIDQESVHNDTELDWVNLLPAEKSSDPLVSLIDREEGFELNQMLYASYSEATAYIKIFDVFDFDRQKICRHLLVSNETLLKRFRLAAKVVRIQPSLFDRVESIPDDFRVMPGKAFRSDVDNDAGPTVKQLAWTF